MKSPQHHSTWRMDRQAGFPYTQIRLMKASILVLILFLSLTASCRSSLPVLDNVLLISVDTLRADYLGCYGTQKVETPNIDRLASSGVLFQETVSATPFTLPSHTSIMTGLIPPAHHIHDNGGFYLNEDIETLAEALRSKGFHTAAFVGAFPLDSRFGLNQGFEFYDDSYPTVANVSEITMPERKGEEVVNAAIQWILGQKTQHWFAFVHLYDPHFPYNAPESFQKMYPDDLYAAEVAYADQQVGRLLSFLKENTIDSKTLVIFTSDHGESLGEHDEKTHGIFAYQSTLRVPLIIAPFQKKTVQTRVRLIDIMPTILDLQNLPIPSHLQGSSLKETLAGSSEPQTKDSYFESLSMNLNARWAPLRGYYSSRFKFIDLPIPELYDIEKDPHESTNLCTDGDLCGQWKKQFDAFFQPYKEEEVTPAAIDAETREKLQALGYVASGASHSKESYGPEDDPKRLISIHNRIDNALTFYNKGHDQKALEIFYKIIQERPDYSIAYLHAAFIQSGMGFPDQAIELLLQAKENGVSGSEIDGKLGLYLYEAGKYDESIVRLKQSVLQDPQNLDNLNYLGMSYAASGNFSEAEETFRKALTVDSSDASTLNNLGTLYLTRKQLEPAARYFQQAIEHNPSIAGAYNGLGVVYAQQRNWEQAIRNWNLAVEKNNQNFDALLNLSFAYLEVGNRAKALELLRRFEQDAPKNRYAADLPKVHDLIQKLQ